MHVIPRLVTPLVAAALVTAAASARAQGPDDAGAPPPAAPTAPATGGAASVGGSVGTQSGAQPGAKGSAQGDAANPASTSADTKPDAPKADSAKSPTDGFQFGSYGRVRIASDLRGGTGRQANVVTHGTRIDEDSYAELELRREDTFKDDIHSKVVATLALFPPFFHFSGNPTQAIAVRNLYAQATYDRYTMWVGARMYRGDDIYLLDFWPLDNQNTVGGGIGGKWGDTSVAAHVGMQRLDDPYQYQTIPVVAPFGVGATEVVKLDRPRVVETVKATQLFRNLSAANPKLGFKVIVYGEAHEISAGVFHDENTNLDRPLPSDTGFLVGTQLGLWTGERDSHVNLFFRHARGIAAYDPLAAPLTFANDRTTSGSSETLVALGANYETGPVGLLAGGYLRFFRDGDPSPTTTQKYDEGTLVLRPEVFLGEHFGVAFEGSYQARRYAVLDPETDSALTASVFRAGVIPYFSPSGRGSYKRPVLRILYAFSARNDGARALYPAEDVFAQRSVEHFLGLGAEWWFNSSSYP